MKPIDQPSDPGGIPAIKFPALQCWNPVKKLITISAKVKGKNVICNISLNDLRKKYHIFENAPLNTLARYRPEIERAASKLIHSNSFDSDGTIFIRYKDL